MFFLPAYRCIDEFISPYSYGGIVAFVPDVYQSHKRAALMRLQTIFLSGCDVRIMEWHAAFSLLSFDQPDADSEFQDLCKRLVHVVQNYNSNGKLTNVLSLRERIRYRTWLPLDHTFTPHQVRLRKIALILDIIDPYVVSLVSMIVTGVVVAAWLASTKF